MATRMNHARLAHRGRATEMANAKVPAWAKFTAAAPANAGRSLSAEEKAAHLAKLGIKVG